MSSGFTCSDPASEYDLYGGMGDPARRSLDVAILGLGEGPDCFDRYKLSATVGYFFGDGTGKVFSVV